MLTAHEARQNLHQTSSQQAELQKQIERFRLERLLSQAIQEELSKNSSKVIRTLTRGSSLQAGIIREILEGKGFENVSIESKSEDHDRYVDSRVDIQFSF